MYQIEYWTFLDLGGFH